MEKNFQCSCGSSAFTATAWTRAKVTFYVAVDLDDPDDPFIIEDVDEVDDCDDPDPGDIGDVACCQCGKVYSYDDIFPEDEGGESEE